VLFRSVAVFDIYGSSGSPREYRRRLTRNGAPASFGDFAGYESCDLYLCFSDCSTDLTVNDLCFYYWPLEDPGVQDTMQVRVNCWQSAMQGVHAAMGWSEETFPGIQQYEEFVDKWLVDGMSTVQAFLSNETDEDNCYSTHAQAVAVPYGPPGGNTYHYLFETWADAGDGLAPSGSCMIAWCIPFFEYGYYWVEQ